MPFVSQKQRSKFAELLKDGKITQKTFDEWSRDTPNDIPERFSHKPLKIKKVKKLK
jgi:hypothetical protein